MICPICGKPFIPANGSQKYCSKTCRNRSHYRRRLARESAPELPSRAGDLADAVSVMWHGANMMAELSRSADPATAALAGRLASAVWRALDEEGLR